MSPKFYTLFSYLIPFQTGIHPLKHDIPVNVGSVGFTWHCRVYALKCLTRKGGCGESEQAGKFPCGLWHFLSTRYYFPPLPLPFRDLMFSRLFLFVSDASYKLCHCLYDSLYTAECHGKLNMSLIHERITFQHLHMNR